MWYMIYAVDHAHSGEKRRAARPAHLARLQALRGAGRLMLAGPLPRVDNGAAIAGNSAPAPDQPAASPGPAIHGSLVVADFASLAEAQAWAADDPYVHAGVYHEVHIHPWMAVFLPECSPTSQP